MAEAAVSLEAVASRDVHIDTPRSGVISDTQVHQFIHTVVLYFSKGIATFPSCRLRHTSGIKEQKAEDAFIPCTPGVKPGSVIEEQPLSVITKAALTQDPIWGGCWAWR